MEDWISVLKIISVLAWNCIWLPVITRPEQYQCRYHTMIKDSSNSQNTIPWGEILLTQPTDRHQRSSTASLKFAVWWFVLSLVISAWWQTQSNWKHFSRSSCLTSWHANRTKVVWRPNVKQSISIQNLSTKTMAATADAMISSDSFRMETMTIVVSKVTSWNQLPLILR